MEATGEGSPKKPGCIRHGVDVVLDFIAGCVSPVIPVLLASGLIAAVLSVCVNFFGMDTGSGTAVVLSAVKDAGFYFLPIFLGFSTGNKLGINGYLGALLGGVLVYSTINGAQGLSFLGLVIYPTTYNSTVIPVILGVLFEAAVYKLLDKVLPGTVKPFLLPLLTVLAAVPVTLLFLGPLGTVLSGWLTGGVMWVSDTFGAWAVGLYAMINPVCVMFGLDKAITPPILTSIAANGYETLFLPGSVASNTAVGGAALAVWFKSRNAKLKNTAGPAGTTAILGITEPALFGVCVPYKRPLAAAMLGGGIGGLFGGFVQLKQYAIITPGLCALPGYIGPDGSLTNLLLALATICISVSSAFVLTLLFSAKQTYES